MNLSFIFGDECGFGEQRNPSPIRGDPNWPYWPLAQLAGRANGLLLRECISNRPMGGGVIDVNEFLAVSGCRGGGGVENGPGVVNGCFSTCKALITTASRL